MLVPFLKAFFCDFIGMISEFDSSQRFQESICFLPFCQFLHMCKLSHFSRV